MATAFSPYVEDSFGCNCPSCRVKLLQPQPEHDAVERAEALLRRFLTNKQAREWKHHQTITVTGASGKEWLIKPRSSGNHNAVVCESGLGVCVWPRDINIAADWALAMLLYLQADDTHVTHAGCHMQNLTWRRN